jgi:flagellar basal-body rod protein FlgC
MPIDPIRRPALMPIPGQSTIRPMFKSLGIAASGLSMQRQRMETIAQNIANAEVTRGADNQPFKRLDVIGEAATAMTAKFPDQGAGFGSAAGLGTFGQNSASSSSESIVDGIKPIVVPVLPEGATSMGPMGPGTGEYGVRVAGIAEDQGEGRLSYEPGHPDADASGYVRYPEINTTQETVKLLDAKRLYEANVAVFQTAKSILRASLDI